jgi:hypothetical protein
MIQLLRALVVGVLLSSALVQGAAAIEVTKVGDKLVRAFRQAPLDKAETFLAGYTVLVKLGKVPPRIIKMLPISSVAVLYFAPNGRVLGWSGKSGVVEPGDWQIQNRGAGNDLCMFFDKNDGQGFCTILSAGRSAQMESTKGNPFGLKANAPVPYTLGYAGQSLGGVAKKLGL